MPENQQIPPSKLRIWVWELRLPFTTASIAPLLLGTAIAWALTGIFFWDVFLLTLIGGVCIHLGANVANDYFDHLSGADEINVEFIRPFTGGSRMIQQGLLSPRAVLAGSLVFFTIGGIIGLYLMLTRGFFIIILGVLGVFFGFFYTAPPIEFVKRGVGEIVIGISFGILLTLGAFYTQTLLLVWEPVIAAIPVALLIASVLYINEFADFNADKAAGKYTLVVRLGRKSAAKLYTAMLAATYLVIVIAVLLAIMNWYTLIALTTIPFSILGVKYALTAYNRPFELIPANAATVFNHLLTTIALAIAYILYGFSIPLLYTIGIGLILLVISALLARKFHLQGKAALATTSNAES